MAVTPDAREPWDQRPGETRKAYAAFLAYRDMGRTRSHRKLAAATGYSHSAYSRWNTEHGWQDRVEAWDQHLDAERNAAAVEQARTMHDEWMNLSLKMLNRAAEGLAKFADKELSPKQVVDLADCSLRFAKAALGVADVHVQVDAVSEDLVVDRRNRMWALLTKDPDAQDVVERLEAMGVEVPVDAPA